MIVTECTVEGCSTLTIGPRCVDHDDAAKAAFDRFSRRTRPRRVEPGEVQGGVVASALGAASPPRAVCWALETGHAAGRGSTSRWSRAGCEARPKNQMYGRRAGKARANKRGAKERH